VRLAGIAAIALIGGCSSPPPGPGPECGDASCKTSQVCLERCCFADAGPCAPPACVDVLPSCNTNVNCSNLECSGCSCHYDAPINCCNAGNNGPCDTSCFVQTEELRKGQARCQCGL
jgi:hypothetical protein